MSASDVATTEVPVSEVPVPEVFTPEENLPPNPVVTLPEVPPEEPVPENPYRRPPSRKDREIYRLAKILGWSQRRVAKKFGITQGSVSKKIKKVEFWLGWCGASDMKEMYGSERLRLGVRFTRMKYEHYLEHCERSWERSCETAITKKTKVHSYPEGKKRDGQEVKETWVETTEKPQMGRIGHLREARLTLKDLLQLDAGFVGPGQKGPIDPDLYDIDQKWHNLQTLAKQKQIFEEQNRMLLQQMQELENMVSKAREIIDKQYAEIAQLKRDAEERNCQKVDNCHSSSREACSKCGAIPGSPPYGRESRKAPLPFVETPEAVLLRVLNSKPLNDFEIHFQHTLTKLNKIQTRNQLIHGIPPLIQKLPTIEWVRKGGQYQVTIPPEGPPS